jgi:purine-cytosine permease-like protein
VIGKVRNTSIEKWHGQLYIVGINGCTRQAFYVFREYKEANNINKISNPCNKVVTVVYIFGAVAVTSATISAYIFSAPPVLRINCL